MQFAQFDAARFLRECWQKQPVLIPNPWTSWTNPLDPDDLAGLACEADIESRLVSRQGGQADGALVCEDGPLAAKRFARLASAYWTLLVQAVDHHVPAVAALIEPFRFVPNWRIDDVMVSYAVDGGGVGAHFDQYDVFLIQGLGQRRWRVGQACDADSPLLPHDDLRLLAEFVPAAEYLLGPGDILYVPPGIAHDGVAVGDDCMTYSVGFRAPARAELLSDWADDMVAGLAPDDRYADPGLRPQANPGEIAPTALAALHAMLTETMAEVLADRAAFARWFGGYTTRPKYADMDWRPQMALETGAVRVGAVVYRNPACRFAFVREEAGVALFVDGDSFVCRDAAAVFAEAVCAAPGVPLDAAMLAEPATADLIARLHEQGSISFDP